MVKYASVYHASKYINISLGTIGPWMKIDFSKENTGIQSCWKWKKAELSNELVAWVLEQRDLHLAVSIRHVIDQARLTILPSTPSFQGTRGWVQKFMRRNNVSLRAKTSISQKIPIALEEKMATFIWSVQDIRKGIQIA